ncbi:hypothetical protein HMPREF9057_01387 [Actinomyces sp. oral taxon 171 str. F0337]|nr:hypothetical protein HMPREF9057_01387 [Actinomyces sp. oral taxon 171 str. F0337]
MPVTVRGGWVAVSQPLGQVIGVFVGGGRKKSEKADSVLFILDIGERGGGHCLARQFPIEGSSLLVLCVDGSCCAVILSFSVGVDGETLRPVFDPVVLLVEKNFLEQLARRAANLGIWQGVCVQEGVDCDEQGLRIHRITESTSKFGRWRRLGRAGERPVCMSKQIFSFCVR